MILKEKYPYIRVGTLEPMRIKDILNKKNSVFAVRQRFRIRVRHISDIRLCKEVKRIMVFDTKYHYILFKCTST